LPSAAELRYDEVKDVGYAPWLQISTVNSIPEPSTFVLAAIGLIGLLAYAWRKRK
jgi:hypothetical protein